MNFKVVKAYLFITMVIYMYIYTYIMIYIACLFFNLKDKLKLHFEMIIMSQF